MVFPFKQIYQFLTNVRDGWISSSNLKLLREPVFRYRSLVELAKVLPFQSWGVVRVMPEVGTYSLFLQTIGSFESSVVERITSSSMFRRTRNTGYGRFGGDALEFTKRYFVMRDDGVMWLEPRSIMDTPSSTVERLQTLLESSAATPLIHSASISGQLTSSEEWTATITSSKLTQRPA